MKIERVFLASLSPFLVLTEGKETKESQAPAGGGFFVRRWAVKGSLGGDGLLLFVGKMRIGGIFLLSLSPFLVLTGGKGDKRKSSPRRGHFLCSSVGGEG